MLGKLARQHDPNVLVGFDHADDAGVYQIGPATALVQTADFFTPIVDDPYVFGQIAAANALSRDEVVLAALGDQIAGWFIEFKAQEWAEYRSQVTRWEIERYAAMY